MVGWVKSVVMPKVPLFPISLTHRPHMQTTINPQLLQLKQRFVIVQYFRFLSIAVKTVWWVFCVNFAGWSHYNIMYILTSWAIASYS